MTQPYTVDSELLPKVITVDFPAEASIRLARDELELAALMDPNACAYFSSDADPQVYKFSRYLVRKQPVVEVNERTLNFSFLRSSLIRQEPMYGLHLDAVTDSGLDQDGAVPEGARLWRVVLNLGDQARKLAYSTQHPETAEIEVIDGFRVVQEPDPNMVNIIDLPPRERTLVHGLAFCASHVMHAGQVEPYDIIAVYSLKEGV
jgi:hypothetical protein